MQYEKKLIILSGAGNAKGTLSLERNAYGVFATLNVYNLPNLKSGEYHAGLKSQDFNTVRALGAGGRILSRFQLQDGEPDINALHCVVFDSRYTPLLYGTNAAARLWAGNMMDGLKRREHESAKESKTAAPPQTDGVYSGRSQDIKDYFFDITPGARIEVPEKEPSEPVSADETEDVPQDETNELLEEGERLLALSKQIASQVYNDGALAEVNYFDKSYINKEIKYSSASDVDTDELLNPVDRRIKELSAKVLKQPLPESAFTVPPASSYAAGVSAAKSVPEAVFYEQIKDQIESLFEKCERFTLLEELMPETRWIRVDFDETKFYTVGLIGTRPDYVCYGVPAEYSPLPPLELGGHCRWLPETPETPEGKGFWLMFQDAKTGEPIEP
ncbi:MAG: hypothetical protein FWH03_04705 [Firmicutes bacterium]|nr:hypothetical protein [Bacillota bacterium]